MRIKEFIKKNFKLYGILAIIIVLGTIGITYALTLGNFNAIAVNTTSSIIDANISYDDGTNTAEIINNGNMYPIDDALVTGPNVADTRVLKVKFNVSGVNDNPADTIYDIAMYFDTLDCQLRVEDLKWRLYKNDSLLSEGSLSPTFDTINNNRLVLTNTQEDLTTNVDKYTFLLWISESCTGDISECDASMDQSSLLNRNLKGSIKVELSTKTKKTLTRVTGEEGSCDYNETEIPVCNQLTYNGESQILVNDTRESVLGINNGGYSYSVMPLGVNTISDSNVYYTAENNVGTNAGRYPVVLKLDEGYKWSDGSTDDKCIYCEIAKKNITFETLNQTIRYGNNISNGSDFISTDGLIAGHNISSYKLSSSIYDVGTGVITADNVKILDSFNDDVTSNYDIKYSNGNVVVNCLNVATPPTIADRKYSGEMLVGVSGGNYVDITGTTTGIEIGTYNATATPKKNYCWADGSTEPNQISWKILNNIVIINLDNSGADNGGTVSIYENFGDYCLDDSCDMTMSTSTNNITIPTKVGYTFGGYYDTAGGTGNQMINPSGYATSDLFDSAILHGDRTLYAKWIVNTYTVTRNYRIHNNGTWVTYSTSELTKNYGSKIMPTGDVSIPGFTYDHRFEYYDSDGNYLGEGVSGDSFTVTGDITVNVLYMPNEYTVTYNSGNLIHSLDPVTNVTDSTGSIKYTVLADTVTVTALKSYARGYIGRVYLEAGRTYIFNCNSTGTFGVGTNQTRLFLVLNGVASLATYQMESNVNYKFTPSTSGEYHLKFGVDTSGETYTFSNISITTDLATKKVTYSNSYGAAPSISVPGYYIDNWYSSMSSEIQVSSSTYVITVGDHTIYGKPNIKKVTIQYYLRSDETLQYESTSSSEGTNYFDTDTRGYIYRNGSMIRDVINYGSQLPSDGLYNYNNSELLNISKKGYSAVEGEEWIIPNTDKTFSQTTRYGYFDFCDDSSRLCGVTLAVNWRQNKVYIKYNVNGGTVKNQTTNSSGVTSTYTTDSSGNIYKNGALGLGSLNYGANIASTGLTDYNNSEYVYVTKPNYSGVVGAEWICLEGDCVGKTFNQASSSYKSSDFCDASNGDCTVTLGVNWKLNSVTIQYDLNGGSFGTTSSSYVFTSDSNEIIYQDGKILTHTIDYGGQLGSSTLRNYNNSSSLNIVKAGYSAPDGAEWKCLSGCSVVGTTYDHDAMYYDEDFCDLTEGNCTVVLGVNWEPNSVFINYAAGGGSIKSGTGGGNYSISSDKIYYTGNLLTTEIKYNSKLSSSGLMNYNNSDALYITKTGHSISADSVWKCTSGCTTSGKIFNQHSAYAASEFCDASNGDCTVTLTANWKPKSYNLTYDYAHSYYYTRPDYMDTGYKVNWDVDFTIRETIYVPSTNYRYMIISNYNNSDKKALSIEITAANLLRVFFGTGQVDTKSSSAITLKENVNIVFSWDASENTYTITATGTTTNISFSGTYDMSGTSATSLRIGTVDNRGSSSVFWKINTSNLKITTSVPYTTKLSNLPVVSDTVDTSFSGWYTGTGGAGTKITTSSTMPASAVTYYAYWPGTASASIAAYSDDNATPISYVMGNYKSSFLGNHSNVKASLIDNNNEKNYYTSGEISNGPITFRLTGTPIENVDYIEYCIDNNNTCVPNVRYTTEQTVKTDSYIRYRAVSKAGITEDTKSFHALVSSGLTTYNINYDANGGTGAPSSQLKNYGETLALSDIIPVREGYTFSGWSINKNATSATYNSGSMFTNNVDTTLYAVWKKN